MDEKKISITNSNILSNPTKKPNEGPTFNVSPKAYKQSYRTEWESMPDFQGWLQAAPGEATRAYCIYCDKTLHAHRLSLLKHMCTVKHSKAALRNFSEAQAVALATVQARAAAKPSPTGAGGNHENKGTPASEQVASKDNTSTLCLNKGSSEAVNANVIKVANASSSSSNNALSADTSNVDESEEEMEEEEEDDDPLQIDCSPPAKICRMEMSTSPTLELNKKPISTHVLDTAKGTPVGGLQVCLYKLIEGRWTHISEGVTSPDGRFADFIGNEFSAGRYKLHFDVDRYFELRKVESFYPFIEVVFDVKSPQEHYHVPILLSPFGYTTYRGS